MSSGKLDDIYDKIIEESHDFSIELKFDVSSIVIPYSKVFKRSCIQGIPVKERDLKFQEILKHEFLNI